MTPDLNQLRQDLGLHTHGHATPDRPSNISTPASEPAPEGICLSQFGRWVLTILGIALGIWLMADPIFALIAFIWEAICMLVSFVIQLIVWGFIFCIALAFLGSIFK